MKYTDIPYFFVFDVESVGLHGEAFQVGFVVVDKTGQEHDSGLFCEPLNGVIGTMKSFDWVKANCSELAYSHNHHQLRHEFWMVWLKWKADGAVMAADVPWPVEARFLSECVQQNLSSREWQGPYPLIDVASVILANGFDPLATYQRTETEKPEHNPLADARQSARLLTMALRGECLTFNP